jgi:hypothetical protein
MNNLLTHVTWPIIVLAAATMPPRVQTPTATGLKAVQSEISIANIEATLHAIDVDRTAASDGERAAVAYIDRTLTGYGIAHHTFDARLWLSWPGRAELTLPGLPTMVGKTAAFAAPTLPGGVSGPLVVNPTLTRRVDQSLAFGPDVRGKIPVVHGYSDTEAVVLAGQQAGALATIQIDATDTLHEDIVTTIWGTPSEENVSRVPTIPFLSLKKTDGDRLLAAVAAAPVTGRVVTEVTRGWGHEPILVADVSGRSADFVLVATHIDAWYHGMTDTGGSDASILEMARVLQQHRSDLARGVRFAWWPGHSFGRYAGSAWYVDQAWADLDSHCVAYTNLDGPGRRGSRIDAVAVSAWPGLADYARESAARISGKTVGGRQGGGGTRVFRPGRDSDSSFQGLGVPYISIGVPGPGNGSPDVDAAGRVVYWHAPEDTIDKIDFNALALDTQYRVAQLFDLTTVPVLPHKLAPIAASYTAALQDLAGAAGKTFDLTSTVTAAAAFAEAATRFDAAPRPANAADAERFNRLVVKLTHALNATLYTTSGRFNQDPAAAEPVLPLLARVKDLPTLPADGDAFGFLTTSLVRGRNVVDATLREATSAIDDYLSRK